MNAICRVTIFGFVFFVVGAVALAAIIVRSPYWTEEGVVRVQPVPFSHAHHVGDAGIDCRYCHRTVEYGAFAGVPSTEICIDCHSQLWTDSPLLVSVRESYEQGVPLSWSRVHDLPDFVYFHHGIHVQKGIACDACHGRVDTMPLMYRKESLHMAWCLRCHRQPEIYQVPPADVFARQVAPQYEDVTGYYEVELEEFDEDHPFGDGTARGGDERSELPALQQKTDCSYCHR